MSLTLVCICCMAETMMSESGDPLLVRADETYRVYATRWYLLTAFSLVRAARASVRPKYIKEVAFFEEAVHSMSRQH